MPKGVGYSKGYKGPGGGAKKNGTMKSLKDLAKKMGKAPSRAAKGRSMETGAKKPSFQRAVPKISPRE